MDQFVNSERNRVCGRLSKRKNVKKAYLTLEEGNTIDVSTGLQD